MATTPTAKSDFDHSEATATNDWNTKYPFFARIAGGLSALWSSKIFTGTEPDDQLIGFYLSDATLTKAVRVLINTGKTLTIEKNTNNDASPSWTTMFTLNGSTSVVTLAGALAMGTNGITGIAGITLASGNIDAGSGGIINAGAIAGATTLDASGIATLGSIVLTVGGANLASGGITNAGAIAGATTINSSGLATLASVTAAGLSTLGTLKIGGGTTITKHFHAESTLDFGNIAAQNGETKTIALTGVLAGDTLAIGTPPSDANTCFTGWVNNNVVAIRFNNYSSGSVNPASATFKVDVWQH